MNFNQKDKNSPYAQLKFSEIVKSPYGKFEVDKYLYETKLQNIYDDYKKTLIFCRKVKNQFTRCLLHSRVKSKISWRICIKCWRWRCFGSAFGYIFKLYTEY